MPWYRRNYVPGGTYFFTIVTYLRRPILTTALGRDSLRAAIEAVQQDWPFTIEAIVLLQDHLHTLWTLPDGDTAYSVRWARIKDQFTRSYLAGGGEEAGITTSRRRRRERGVWQRRFWEYTVRGEDDFKRCLDYVHWNPVKHGLVGRVRDYSWSSFERYVKLGEYDPEWGSSPVADVAGAEWE